MQLDKTKSTTILAIVLLMASVTLIAMPVNAQPSHGGAPAANGSILLPAGVTPDMTIDDTVVVTVSPHVLGLGQTLLINMWMEPAVSLTRYLTGYKVTLTKPDGSTDVFTLNSFQGDSTAWMNYAPDQIGTWKVDFEMPGAYFPAGNYTVPLGISGIAGAGGVPYMESFTRSLYYAPFTAQQQTFVVQSDMISSWPGSPLPTDYWTRPIPFENREWSQVAGDYPWFGPGAASINGYNWPADTSYYYSPQYQFYPYVTAPNSAHILWKRLGPLGTTGSGIVGGAYGTKGIATGGGGPNIILEGKCYQTYSAVNQSTGASITRWQCYDLRTGQVYWDRPLLSAVGTSPAESAPTYIEYATGAESTPGAEFSTGLTTSLVAINGPSNVATYPGAQDQGGYIYNSLTTSTPGTMVKYNPLTGAITTNITLPLPPLGESMYCMNGYVLSLQTVNTTGGPGLPGTPTSGQYRLINWTTIGSGNFASRVVSNISFPNAALGTIPGLSVGTQEDFATGMYFLAKESNFFDLGNMGSPYVCVVNNLNPLAAVNNYGENDNASGFRLGTTIEGISMTTGQVLYMKTFNDLTNPLGDTAFSGSAVVADHGKLAVAMRDGTFSVFDELTGALLFKTEAVNDPWDITGFGAYGIASAYGMFYYGRYSHFDAYDWNNGKIVWSFEAPAVPFETPYSDANGNSVYPWYSGSAQVADGKVYIYNAEHSTTQPVTRGWKLWCLNATTGQEIWNITTPGSISAIADGYISVSATDGYQYVFGIGKTATTVTAPQTAVPLGTSVLIEGTVLDQSPAQPNTPCVSKDSMATQMEYLHRQMPIDGIWHNVTMTGVPVTLTAIGSDNTVIDLGTATTNAYDGTFAKAWTPPKEDTYKITAHFAADDSYGSSYAGTSLLVGPAPATPETPATNPPADLTPIYYGLVGGVIAIIIAVAIVGMLILRKRP